MVLHMARFLTISYVSITSAFASSALTLFVNAPSRLPRGPLRGFSAQSRARLRLGVAGLHLQRQPVTMGVEVKTEPHEDRISQSAGGGDTWRCLVDSPAELRCGVTLVCGQSFRWRATGESEWTGVIADRLVTVREDDSAVHLTAWQHMVPQAHDAELADGAVSMERVRPDDELMKAATDYFGLATPLAPLYDCWGQADPLWAQLATRFPGLRVLRQDPVECLFCFICSSNNNIARISLMIDRISQKYGTWLGTHGGYNFYTFPEVEALARADEDDLRALGTGYRAKFIVQSAATLLQNGGRDWLMQLRAGKTSHVEARDALTTLHGVGPKVADCVCLFALDKTGAIPVDTHVWQITVREMDAKLSEAKSLTPSIYAEVGGLWRQRYGEYAGWAHTILFAADLAKFKKLRKEALGEEDAVAASAGALSPSGGNNRKRKVEPKVKAEDVGEQQNKQTPRRRGKSKASKDSDEDSAHAGQQSELIGAGTQSELAETFEALYGPDSLPASPLFKATPSKAKRTSDSRSKQRPQKVRSRLLPEHADEEEENGSSKLALGDPAVAASAAGGRASAKAPTSFTGLPKIPRKRARAPKSGTP